MRNMQGTLIALVCAAGVSACSAQSKTTAPPPPTVQSSITSTEKGGSRQQAITVTATVESVNAAERLVTLRGPNGDTNTVRVSDEVRNLPQVKRGDHVVATYYESIAYEVIAPGDAKPGISGTGATARAPLGEKPAGLGAREITLVADVEKLDAADRTAVLRGPQGQVIEVNVQNPTVFDKVKVGDRVQITYTEAIAIDVHPAK